MLHRLLLLILLILSSFVHASTCLNLVNQINVDVTNNPSTITKKQLPWMNLNWLKKQLGVAEIKRISSSQSQYKWVCPDNLDTFISVMTDNQGIITKVNGAYSSDNGAGMISVCLKCAIDQSAVAQAKPMKIPALSVQPLKKPQLPTPILKKPATKSSPCTAVMKQIDDIAHKGNGSATPYPWESLTWLQHNFGTTSLQNSNNISGYEWKCDSESIMYFIKDKQIIYAATKCINGECSVSYASRVNGIMKGTVTQIQPHTSPSTGAN